MTEQLCDFPTCQLARQKGFDEVCRHAWVWDEETKEKLELERPHPGSAALKTISIASTMWDSVPSRTIQLIIKWNKDGEFNNKVLPKMFFARPTQDLLERWLREVHSLWLKPHCFEPWQDTLKRFNNPETYAFELYNIKGQRLSMDMPVAQRYATWELAKEPILVNALKLLPDADIIS